MKALETYVLGIDYRLRFFNLRKKTAANEPILAPIVRSERTLAHPKDRAAKLRKILLGRKHYRRKAIFSPGGVRVDNLYIWKLRLQDLEHAANRIATLKRPANS